MSRRPDRQEDCRRREGKIIEQLLLPFNILKANGEEVLMKAGIKDWREDLVHLRNQLEPSQVGTCDSFDLRQQKRDDRKLEEERRRKQREVDVKVKEKEAVAEKDYNDNEDGAENEEEGEEDEEYIEKRKGKVKIDVMGPVSLTGDARRLSARDRAAFAASVVRALGVNVADTNISVFSSWNKARQNRVKVAKAVKESFVCPGLVSLHWDGKILKVKGGLTSNRVAVYVAGIDSEKRQKLLGAPEVKIGTGEAEAAVVVKLLEEWEVRGQVASLVFDTTSTNSSAKVGACRWLEDFIKSPVLWAACRHHILELHVNRVVAAITGHTKDPGVKLFRRLKVEWSRMTIDYSNLRTFSTSDLPRWMEEEAAAVLAWGQRHLVEGTFARGDYREFLQLVVVCLGGGREDGFTFRIPGADHHARWMSKGIYYLKLFLLSHQFRLSEEEKEQVSRIVIFVIIIYARAWFESPLPCAAARNDLNFGLKVVKYRLLEPMAAFDTLESIYRHLWYVTGPMVALALADTGLEDEEREELARELYKTPRGQVKSGRPTFPVLLWLGEEVVRPRLATLVTTCTWLIFDRLQLTGIQVRGRELE